MTAFTQETTSDTTSTAFSIDKACPVTTDAALDRALQIAPQLDALVDDQGSYSYGDLGRDVAAARAGMDALGIRSGDRVGICMKNSYAWVVVFLASTSLGAIAVPVNTRFKSRDLAYGITHSGMSLLFIEERVLSNDILTTIRSFLPEVDSRLPGPAVPALQNLVLVGSTEIPTAATSWADLLELGRGRSVPAKCSPDQPALIQYTSGTTGSPKGVVLTHRAICGNGFAAAVRMGLRTGDRMHSARPFFHVAGTTQSVLACLQQVATLVTMPRFVADDALRLIVEERCTHISGNDTMAVMLLDEYRLNPSPLQLRGAWLAASAPTVGAVIDELGAREAVVAYGLSEAAPNVALSAWWEPEKVRRTASMLPQMGVEVAIRDENGDHLQDRPGEIVVRGWNVMQGYWDNPQATAESIDEGGWLSTGDIGILRNGRLEFLGRLKEIIRVGGENVSPVEVEDTLKTHPEVAQVCVVAVPDDRLVEVICAIIEPVKGSNAQALQEEIGAWCAKQLAGFKVPRHVLTVGSIESLGMTESSKIRRKDARSYALSALGLEA